jgi:hypothetical protein
VLEAFCECLIIRRVGSCVVLRIQLRKGVIARIRFGAELAEDRGEQAVDVLLGNIPEIKIEIS